MTRRGRWRWWLVLLVLCAVSGLTVLLRMGAQEGVPRKLVVPVAATTLGTARTVAKPAASIASASASSALMPLPAVGAPMPTSASVVDAKTDTTDICGLGQVTLAMLEKLAPAWAVPGSESEGRKRLVAALLAGSEREQVVGGLLAGMAAVRAAQAMEGTPCSDSNALCQADRFARHRGAAQPMRDRSVKLALNSRDPWVFAVTASDMCGGLLAPATPAASSCALLTPDLWRARAGDDAAPSLWQAELASSRQDAAAVAAALQQAAHATRLSHTFATSLGPLLPHQAFKAMNPIHQQEITVELLGLSASGAISGMFAVTQHCPAHLAPGSAQRETCNALLRLLLQPGGTLMGQAMGTSMAKRLGWPPHQVDALEERKLALQEQALRAVLPQDLLSCAGIATAQKQFADVAALGEVGALELRIKEGGRSIAELAAQAASGPR